MRSMIEFQNVSFSYKGKSGRGKQLYQDLSFSVYPGTMTALIGSSGSGKTTLLNLIAGFLRPQQGKILVDGKAVSDLSPDEACRYRNEKIGFIYQSFHLLPELNAMQNVMLPMIIAKKPDGLERSEKAMRALGIWEKAESYPARMSGGEQQRTAIARAIVNDADIILADEPTGNLDPANAEAVKTILKGFAEDGKTVLIVTHDMSFKEISDCILNTSDFRCG